MNYQNQQQQYPAELAEIMNKLKSLNNGLINQLLEAVQNNIQNYQGQQNWVDQSQYNGQMGDYLSSDQEQKISQQHIDEIPEVSYQDISSRLQKNQSCPICFKQYEQTKQIPIRDLPCHHLFHKECIDPWLLQKPNCPTCKHHIN